MAVGILLVVVGLWGFGHLPQLTRRIVNLGGEAF